MSGIPPAWSGTNISGGVHPLSESIIPNVFGGTKDIFSVGGVLYMYVAYNQVWDVNSLLRSTDFGQTWQDQGVIFSASDNFSPGGVLQFGKDNQGAPDSYVYVYSASSFADGVALARVDKNQLSNRSAYQFFSGFDGNGKPQWTSNAGQKQPVFTDPAGTEWGTTAVYDPYLHRYLLTVRHNGESGEWGLFDSDHPWGPWTTVAYGKDFPSWTYSPDPDGASEDRPAYMHSFPQKWMSSDGKTLWQIFDRGDQLNLVKATLTLKKHAVVDGKSR